MPTISAAPLPEKPSAWVAAIVRSIVVAPGDGDDTGGITRMSRVGWYDRPRAASTAGSGRHHRNERRQPVGGPDGDADLAGRSDARRGGEEGVQPGSTRWGAYYLKKNRTQSII